MNLLGVLSCYLIKDRIENLSVYVTLRTDCVAVTFVHVTLEFTVFKSGLCKLF